jgi:small subunit ribosomal protein S35
MPLRFRYTTYMGEQHPAEKKVVLEFSPADMPDLTPVQTDKLRKLLGPRYNPEKDTVRMSCEMYETQAQNKRYLGDTVDALLAEARVCLGLTRPTLMILINLGPHRHL